MSRNKRRLSKLSSGSKASAYNSYSAEPSNPFGPMMAEEIYGHNRWDADDECVVGDYDDVGFDFEMDTTGFKFGDDNEVHSFHFHDQTELSLETNAELESRLRSQINIMKRAYATMCHDALKWHYLMEDVEDNQQIQKMFKDMQMVRKLSGYEDV